MKVPLPEQPLQILSAIAGEFPNCTHDVLVPAVAWTQKCRYKNWNMDKSRWIPVLAALFCVLSVASAMAQTFRGGISGTVADKTGAMIPNADVDIEQKETGLKLNVTTTGAGVFSFADLAVGFYAVTIGHSGFQSQKLTDLEVQVGRVASLTVTLNLSGAAETITVAADAATIETNQTALNAVVPERVIQEVPLNGRDFSNLLLLTPGFNGVSMNGNRADQNNWQIDGVDNNDFWLNTAAVNQGSISSVPAVLLPIDSIAEFNQQSVGGADFGRNSGSMIDVVTKSGTNDFHGSFYYFHRNDALAKESPFTPPDASDKLRNHHFGFFRRSNFEEQTVFLFELRRATSHRRQCAAGHRTIRPVGGAGGSLNGRK